MYFYTMAPNPLNNNKPFGIISIFGDLPQNTFVYLDVENKRWVGPVSKEISHGVYFDLSDKPTKYTGINQGMIGQGGNTYTIAKSNTFRQLISLMKDCFIRLKFFKRCDRIIEEIGEYSE